jgi:hypothetical protein
MHEFSIGTFKPKSTPQHFISTLYYRCVPVETTLEEGSANRAEFANRYGLLKSWVVMIYLLFGLLGDNPEGI